MAKPGLEPRSYHGRARLGNLLCRVADVSISYITCLKRVKGNGRTVHEACSSRQVSSQRTVLVSEFSSPFCSFSSSLTSLPVTAHTSCPAPVSCHFPEEISRELPSAMESPRNSGLGLPSDCGLPFLAFICQTDCESASYPLGELTII